MYTDKQIARLTSAEAAEERKNVDDLITVLERYKKALISQEDKVNFSCLPTRERTVMELLLKGVSIAEIHRLGTVRCLDEDKPVSRSNLYSIRNKAHRRMQRMRFPKLFET